MKKLLSVAILFASLCGGLIFISGCDNIKQLETPNILSYSGSMLTWTNIENASGYEVTINGSTFNTDENSYRYVTSSDFSVSVTAIGDGETYSDSSPSVTKNIHFLSTPTNVSVSDGCLVWNVVPNATRYEVKNCKTNAVTSTTTNKFTNVLKNAQQSYCVRAIGTEFNISSQYSQPFNFTILPEPTALKYNLESHIISWDPIDSVSGYKLKIGESVVTIQNQTSYPFTPTLGKEYPVTVSALGNNSTVFNSKESTPIRIKQLDMPTVSSITLKSQEDNSTSVQFKAVPYAAKYKILVNNVQITETGNSFSYTFPVDENEIKIQAVANLSATKIDGVDTYFIDSDFAIKTCIKLDVPDRLFFEDNKIKFSSVNNAVKYQVLVAGQEFLTETTNYAFSSLSAGSFDVKVKAVGDDVGTLSGEYSSPISMTKLPQITNITVDTNIVSWESAGNAIGYSVLINDNQPAIVNDNKISIANIETTSIRIQVKALGNNNNNVIDSNLSDVFILTQLDTPSNVAIDNSGILTWNTVPYSTNYLLDINGKKLYTTDSSYDLKLQINNGEGCVATIKALAGVNGKFFDSKLSSSVNSTRLDEPKNIRIEQNKICWDAVGNAVGYKVVINGNSDIVTDTSYFPNIKVENASNMFSVQAVSNLSNSTTSSPFFESTATNFTFKTAKLAPPQNVVVKKTKNSSNIDCFSIEWDVVENASSYVLTIGGVVKTVATNSYEYIIGTANGIFTFYVQAIGDGCNYVDSNETMQITKMILPSTKLDISNQGNNEYLLYWTAVTNASKYKYVKNVYDKSTMQKVDDLCFETVYTNKTTVNVILDTENYVYEFYIIVVGDNIEIYDSMSSNVIRK